MEIKTIDFNQEIPVFCLTAKNFPDDVGTSHQSLHQLIDYSSERKYFGLFWYDAKKGMIYKAGATEIGKGDLKELNLEKVLIPAGEYCFVELENYMENINSIQEAFQFLHDNAPVSKESMNVEWYMTMKKMRCMMLAKG